jgi:CubicO group peptidase (beta-lactamase class C family)
MPLDEFVRTRITAPLGMKDTHFFLPVEQRERLAAVYASVGDGRIVRAPEGARGQGAYVDGPRRSFSGGAGLLSTARDYARFLEMIRQGGALDGVRIVSPRTVKLMTTNQVGNLHSTTGLGFGLGFETTDRYGANGMDSEGAYGWGGAYGTMYRVDPEARLVMLLMIQLLPNGTDIRGRFPTLVYQALLETPSVTRRLSRDDDRRPHASSAWPLRSGSVKISAAASRKNAEVVPSARPIPMPGSAATAPIVYGASAPAIRPTL